MQRWMRGPKRRGQGMQGRRFASMNRARARCTLLNASENKCRFLPAGGSTHRSHQFAFHRSRFSRNESVLPSHNAMHRAQRLGGSSHHGAKRSSTAIPRGDVSAPPKRANHTSHRSWHEGGIGRQGSFPSFLPSFLPSIRPSSSAVGGTTCKMRLYMLGHILVARDMHDKLTYTVRWSSFGARQATDRSRHSRMPVTRVRDAFGKW